MKKNKLLSMIAACIMFIFSLSGLLNLAAPSFVAKSFTYDSLAANVREVMDFNTGWTFSKGEGRENAGSSVAASVAVSYIPNDRTQLANQLAVYNPNYVKGANGETWTDVSLPHTYNDTDTFDDYVEALNTATNKLSHNGERQLYGGTAWYKKNFYIPASYEGKKIYIEFEAARQVCQIWLNGTEINGVDADGNVIDGVALNGFVPFGYDLSQGNTLQYGAWNEITVLVDNSFPYYVYYDASGNVVTMYEDDNGVTRTTADNGNPIVWHDSHWHPNYGGLYRNSYLHILNPLQLTLPLYSFMATQGTYVYTSEEDGVNKTAKINVDTEIANYTNSAQTFTVVARIKDMSNVIVGEMTTTKTLTANTKTYYQGDLNTTISNVKRWSTDYPYLYTVECLIVQNVDGNPTVIDNNSTKIGVRTFRATTNKGFLLNENYVYLHGWGQKSTNEWAGIGAAYPDWMQEYVIGLMKNAGGNYIRWGHTSGGAAQIKAADKLGIIVTQPGVDGEGPYTGEVPAWTKLLYTNQTYDIRKNAFRDMVIYFRNNASILFWEIGNQTMDTTFAATMRGIINDYDYAGRDINGNVSNVGAFAATTSKTSRLTTVRHITDETKNFVDVAETTEGSGGSSVKPNVEGEYNRYEVRRGVWDTYTEGFENFENTAVAGHAEYDVLTSENFATYQVYSYYTKLLSQGLGHMGGANWIFSDSISHGRLLSEVARCSGEVDATMLEKESYYVCQVLYGSSPANPKSHIIGHWNYATAGTIDKYVVSKAATVKLFVQYEEGGETKTKTYLPSNISNKYLFTFSNVTWKSGKVFCKGYDSAGNEIPGTGDEIFTHGAPASIRISNNVTNPYGLLANGSDYLILDVELLDANGRRCSTFDGEYQNQYVNFSLTNEAVNCNWVGGYNSGLTDTIRSKSLYFEAGITRIAIRTTKNAGSFIVNASMGNLTASHTYTSTAITNLSGNGVADYNYQLLTTRTASVDISQFTEPNYNTVAPVAELDVQEIIGNPSISDYVSNLECYGPSSYFEIKPFAVGSKMYVDKNYTWGSVPHRYVVGEYVMLDNMNCTTTMEELIVFTMRQNCTMLLIFPVGSTLPAWVDSNYVLSNQNFLSNQGVSYVVYEREVEAEQTYSLGSATVTGNVEVMYILGFTIPAVYQGSTLLEETFPSTWTPAEAEASHGAIISTPTGTTSSTVTITDKNGVSKNAMNLIDTKNSTTNYVAYPIIAQTSGVCVVEFDYWVNNTTTTTYARVFFQHGLTAGGLIYDNDGSNTAMRMYFNNNVNVSKINIYMQSGTATQTGNFTQNTYDTNCWYRYRVVIDQTTATKKMTFYISEDNAVTWATLNSTVSNSTLNYTSDKISHIMFAAGNNKTQDIAFANVNVYTVNVINSVAINGATLSRFDPTTNYYFIEDTNETSHPNLLPHSNDYTLTKSLVQGTESTYDLMFSWTYNSTALTYTMRVNLGAKANTDTLTASIDYYRRRVLMSVNSNDATPVTYIYIFSYAYYSEYGTSEGAYSYDRLILTMNNVYSPALKELYQGKKAYEDRYYYFDSIPIEYVQAEVGPINVRDFSRVVQLKFKLPTTILMMLQISEAHLVDVNGWTDTQEIVTLSNGWIMKVYTKNVAANVLYTFDYTEFNGLLSAPVFAYKPTQDVLSNHFLYDDFSNIDNNPSSQAYGLPYGWKAYDGDGAGNKIIISTQQSEADGEDMIVFEDRSSIDASGDPQPEVTWSSVTEANTKFGYINKNFSNLPNKFTYTTKIWFHPNKNYLVSYVRFWFMDGDLTVAGYANDKTQVATEIYFYQDSDKNTYPYDITLQAREWDSADNPIDKKNTNQNVLLSGMKRDTWITLVFEIDVGLHEYNVSYSFDDVTTTNGLTTTTTVTQSTLDGVGTQYFLKNSAYYLAKSVETYCVDNINNLVIGTSKNRANYFAVKEVLIEQVRAEIVSGISYTYTEDADTSNDALWTSVPAFDELTREYAIVLNANNDLPQACRITAGPNARATIPNSYTFNRAGSFYDLVGYDERNTAYSYKLHLYANNQFLNNKISSLPAYQKSLYTASSWNNYTIALAAANLLLTNNSHNYGSLYDAYDALVLAENDLTYNLHNGDFKIGKNMQISNDEFIEFVGNFEIYYNENFTLFINRQVNDSSSFSVGHVLTFANALPAGTRILMVDYAFVTPKFYYYNLTQASTVINFEQNFYEMGYSARLYFHDTTSYEGNVRLYFDFSNAAKLVGANSVTFSLNATDYASINFTILDRDTTSLVLTATAVSERSYTLTAENADGGSFYAISAVAGSYVKKNNNIYFEKDGFILIPGSITSSTLYVPTKLLISTTYEATNLFEVSADLTLPAGVISTAIKVELDNNSQPFITKSTMPLAGINIHMTFSYAGEVVSPAINFSAEKLLSGTTFENYLAGDITFDDVNATVNFANTANVGLYRLKFEITINGQTSFDYLYVIVR